MATSPYRQIRQLDIFVLDTIEPDGSVEIHMRPGAIENLSIAKSISQHALVLVRTSSLIEGIFFAQIVVIKDKWANFKADSDVSVSQVALIESFDGAAASFFQSLLEIIYPGFRHLRAILMSG
jgi:hypothetical protein